MSLHDTEYFDPDYFDPDYFGGGFETAQDESTSEVVGTEHYTCERCGYHYPRKRVVVQNGLVVCRGAQTNNCFDEMGAAAERARRPPVVEEPPRPLPSVQTDM